MKFWKKIIFFHCSEALQRYHRVLCKGSDYHNPNHPLNILEEAWKKVHYPPETTTIWLIVKLTAMYKQTDQKKELLKAFEDFHHEFINENLMISHKMLSENYRDDLNNLFNLYTKVFDFTDMEMVITGGFFSPHIFQRAQLIHFNCLSQYSSRVWTFSSDCLRWLAKMGKALEHHRLLIG